MKTLSLLLFLLIPLASSSQAQSHSAVVKHTPDGFVIVDVSDTPVADASAVLLTARADGEQGWSLRVLRPDETPSDVLASRDREADVVVMQPNDRVDQEAYDALDRSRAALQGARRAMRQSHLTLRSDRVRRDEIIETEDRMDVVGDGEIIDEEVYELGTDVRGLGSRGGRSVYYEVTARMERGFALTDPIVSELSDAPALDDLTLQTDGSYTTVEMRFRFEDLEALNAWREAGAFERVQAMASAIAEAVSIR